MHKTVPAVLAAASLLLAPLGLQAQEAAPRQVFGLAFAGLSVSTRDLGTATVANAADQVQFTNKMTSGPSFGLGVAVPLRGEQATMRVSGAYAPLHAENVPAICDGAFDCGAFDSGEATATVFSGTVAVTFQSGDLSRPLRPYFLVGAALRAYRFDDADCSAETLTCEALGRFLSDQVRPNLKVGIGTFLGAGRIRAMAEAHALFGTFQATESSTRGESQNDLVFSLGIMVPLISR